MHLSNSPDGSQSIFVMAVSRTTAAMGYCATRGLASFAALQCRILGPKSANEILSILREFLRFSMFEASAGQGWRLTCRQSPISAIRGYLRF
jgi:hypothetical protein